MKILVINCGSSSLKYQLIDMNDEHVMAKGNYERIGEQEAFLTHKVNGNATVIKKAALNLVSLSTPIGKDEEDELGYFIEDKTCASPIEEADKISRKEELYEAIKSLTPREQRIIFLRFGLDGKGIRTLGSIGDELNLTRERIRQIEGKSIRKLRRYYNNKQLEFNYNVLKNKKRVK